MLPTLRGKVIAHTKNFLISSPCGAALQNFWYIFFDILYINIFTATLGRSDSVEAKIPSSEGKNTSATMYRGGLFFTSGSDTVPDETALPEGCSCGRDAAHPGEGGMTPAQRPQPPT